MTILRDLDVGDVFKMFNLPQCPKLRILAIRAPVPDYSTQESILMSISGNVYTLERLDAPGSKHDVTLDVFTEVHRVSPKGKPAARPAMKILAGVLILVIGISLSIWLSSIFTEPAASLVALVGGGISGIVATTWWIAAWQGSKL